MDSSSFDNDVNNPFMLTDIEQIRSNGATSDTFKVRIYGKWHFLKRPKKEFSEHPIYKTAFDKEFEIGSQINHPNIVRYLKKGIDEKGIFLQTEYVDGWTLNEFIDKNLHYFKYKDHAYRFTEQLLSALNCLHTHRILHLDLKPENIMITYIGLDVKLIDLGFAYSNEYLYQSIGRTDKYAAPEQLASDNNSINQCADIYGFGNILLYLFTKTSNRKLIRKIPQPFRDCVDKCLQFNPFDRFQSIGNIQSFLRKKRFERKVLTVFWIAFPFLILFFSILASSSHSYSVEPILVDTPQPFEPIHINEEIKSKTPFMTKLLFQMLKIGIVGCIGLIVSYRLTKRKRKKNTINR